MAAQIARALLQRPAFASTADGFDTSVIDFECNLKLFLGGEPNSSGKKTAKAFVLRDY